MTINGTIVSKLGVRADPEADDIRVDTRRVGSAQRHRYLLVNKPRGYVTTRSDPQRRKTVMDLVSGVREYVYPVGRLDYDSEGLLLLTNDGALAQQLTHPRGGLIRVYEAVVRGVPTARELSRFAAGIWLEKRRTAPTEIRLMGSHRTRQQDQARVQVTLREGRNRQVRRMFDAIGHPVLRLRRIQLGPLRDRGLPPGQVRELTLRDLDRLRQSLSSGPAPGGSGSAGHTK